jgi:hypothetical protein
MGIARQLAISPDSIERETGAFFEPYKIVAGTYLAATHRFNLI